MAIASKKDEELIKEAWRGKDELHPYSIEHESMEDLIKLVNHQIIAELETDWQEWKKVANRNDPQMNVGINAAYDTIIKKLKDE